MNSLNEKIISVNCESGNFISETPCIRTKIVPFYNFKNYKMHFVFKFQSVYLLKLEINKIVFRMCDVILDIYTVLNNAVTFVDDF